MISILIIMLIMMIFFIMTMIILIIIIIIMIIVIIFMSIMITITTLFRTFLLLTICGPRTSGHWSIPPPYDFAHHWANTVHRARRADLSAGKHSP